MPTLSGSKVYSKPKFSFHDFRKLQKGKDILAYLDGRQWNHGTYCHYINLSNVNSILGSRAFRIFNVSGFNDELDKKQFDPQHLFFSLCFATGVHENLALWYMYAGMNGRGGRFVFTKSQIKNLFDLATYTLYKSVEKGKEKIASLVEGRSMKTSFVDVLYKYDDPKKDTVDLKYNTMTNYNLSKEEYGKISAELIGREKGLVWYYEKETRLIVEIIGDAAKRIDEKGQYFVEASIPDKVYKDMKVQFAPEIREDEVNGILNEHKAILKFARDSSRLSCSEYSGTVKMDLCGKCDKKKG